MPGVEQGSRKQGLIVTNLCRIEFNIHEPLTLPQSQQSFTHLPDPIRPTNIEFLVKGYRICSGTVSTTQKSYSMTRLPLFTPNGVTLFFNT